MTTATGNGLRTQLRGHQDLAVDGIVTEFLAGAPRATVLMACGTGKTLVGVNAVHEVAPHGRALVVMPTKDLLEQTAAAWHREGRGGTYIGICGRSTPDNAALSGVLTMCDAPKAAGAQLLAEQVARADGPVSVFCTYASLKKISTAHRDFDLPDWDVVIADEAHRTVGNLESSWAVIHDNCRRPFFLIGS